MKTMKTVSMRIGEKTYQELKEFAEKTEQKPTELLRKIAENFVNAIKPD